VTPETAHILTDSCETISKTVTCAISTVGIYLLIKIPTVIVDWMRYQFPVFSFGDVESNVHGI